MAAVRLIQTTALCKNFGGLQAVENVDFDVKVDPTYENSSA